MKNHTQTIITQYRESPVLTAILANWNANIDPAVDLRSFYDLVWNVQTATGYGLDVWGRIVGVKRYLQVASTQDYFGFREATGVQPFGQGVFFDGNGTTTTQLALTDAVFRDLILLKAQANLTNCSAQSLNTLLAGLFKDRGRCYVVDNRDMTFTYAFFFTLTPVDYTLLQTSGVLPRPAGVSYSILQGV